MIHIIKAALPMCAQTEKATFLCKDNYRANLYIYVWSVGKGLETADVQITMHFTQEKEM